MPEPKSSVPYPLQEFERANKVGIILNKRGRHLEYFEETYKLWFLSGLEAGSEDNLQKCCGAMALDYDDIVSQVAEENTQLQYYDNTRKTRDLDVLGAPSLSVGNEILWGDDRLEDAIRFAEID